MSRVDQCAAGSWSASAVLRIRSPGQATGEQGDARNQHHAAGTERIAGDVV